MMISSNPQSLAQDANRGRSVKKTVFEEKPTPIKLNASKYPRRLLIALILIKFFPIPKLPILHIAPENFLFLMGFLYIVFSSRANRKTTSIISLVLLYLLFSVLDQIHNLVLGLNVAFPMEYLRAIVLLLMFFNVGMYTKDNLFLIKLLTVVGVMEVVFGSMIYFVGEPFASVRNWMMQSATSTERISITAGSQLTGLYCLPHVFSYLVASFPMLAVVLYRIEKKKIWLIAFFILLIGLFLNAERSSMGAMFLVYGLWMLKTKGQIKNIVLLAIVGLFVMGLSKIVKDINVKTEATASYAHGNISDRLGETSFDEVADRLMWQLYGAVSVLKHPLVGPSKEDYVREVLGKNENSSLSKSDIDKVPPPHNHYVNMGVRTGVLGWVILAFFVRILLTTNQKMRKLTAHDTNLSLRHLGVSLALLAAMMNSIFHNAGIFTPELATIALLGLWLSQVNFPKNQVSNTGSPQ